MKIGTPDLRDANAFRTALKFAGCRIGDWASDMLNQPSFTVAETESEIELVRTSVAELGFPNGDTRTDIYASAIGQDLELCPSEVGPRLRLEYKDQPSGEWLLIAMEPINALGRYLSVWDVTHVNDVLWISSYYGSHDIFLDASFQLVFLRRKAA